MEVLRKTKKSNGVVYRIYDNHPVYHIYEIEFKKGSFWFPAFNPKNKLFSDLEIAKSELDKLCAD